jgi:hypothetical protein
MKNIIIAVILVTVVGFGAYFWYNQQLQNSKNLNVVSRLVSSSSSTATFSVSNFSSFSSTNKIKETTNILKKGNFVSLDPLHYASGEVRVEKTGDKLEVVFADNFATNPDGPDLYVWLVPTQKLGGAVNGVNTKNVINLGVLENKKGSQKYSVAQQEYDKNNYAVVIWCQAFGIQFSNAVLN